jgi:hypothetical protein
MTRCRYAVGLLAAAAVTGPTLAHAQESFDQLQRRLEKRAETIRPPAAQVRYQEIPWVLDLQLAVQTAKEEKRPIFFWAAGGRDRDGVPLERC